MAGPGEPADLPPDIPVDTSRRTPDSERGGALAGLQVLDVSNLIAGPYCAAMLGEFGADVIKVELPGRGDPARTLGTMAEGTSMMWRALNRGKRLITLDLHAADGQDLFRRLVHRADVVVQNFLPGTLTRWGLDYADLAVANPQLVMVSISGFGQSGEKAGWPGVARSAMAYSGIMHLTGHAEGPPLIPGSAGLADYLSGVYGAFGALAALRARERTGEGQEVDVALYEATFQMLGDLVETYDYFGEAQGRVGAMNPHAAPHNNFRSRDDRWVAIGCSSDQMFRKLATAMGRPELLDDQRFCSNPDRVAHRADLEAIVAEWTQEHRAERIVETLVGHGVPASLVYSIEDAFNDPHYWQRGAIVRVATDDIGELATRGITPKLTRTPGHVGKPGGRIGRDNEAVYVDLLGLTADELADLERRGVV